MSKKIKRTYTLYQKTAAGVWAGSVLLFAAGALCFYLPQHKSLADIEKRYQESCRKADLAKEASSETNITKLEAQTRETTEKLNALTIPSDRVSGLVFDVGRMATQLNLAEFASKSISEQSSSDSKTKSKSPLADAWLSIEFSGSYQQFAQFINLLERNNPAIFVEKVFVTRGPNGGQGSKYELELSVLTTLASNSDLLALTNNGK